MESAVQLKPAPVHASSQLDCTIVELATHLGRGARGTVGVFLPFFALAGLAVAAFLTFVSRAGFSVRGTFALAFVFAKYISAVARYVAFGAEMANKL